MPIRHLPNLVPGAAACLSLYLFWTTIVFCLKCIIETWLSLSTSSSQCCSGPICRPLKLWLWKLRVNKILILKPLFKMFNRNYFWKLRQIVTVFESPASLPDNIPGQEQSWSCTDIQRDAAAQLRLPRTIQTPAVHQQCVLVCWSIGSPAGVNQDRPIQN